MLEGNAIQLNIFIDCSFNMSHDLGPNTGMEQILMDKLPDHFTMLHIFFSSLIINHLILSHISIQSLRRPLPAPCKSTHSLHSYVRDNLYTISGYVEDTEINLRNKSNSHDVLPPIFLKCFHWHCATRDNIKLFGTQ